MISLSEEYQRKQIEMLSRTPNNDMAVDTLKDKVSTLVALYYAYLDTDEDGTLLAFQDYIKVFFNADPDAQVILSTGHRAKGLEYKRVFVLQNDKLPHPKATTGDALTQERNLMYVMYTRAMDTLYLVQEYVTPLVETPVIEAPAIVEEIVPVVETKHTLPTFKPAIGAKADEEMQKVGYKFPVEMVAFLESLAEQVKAEGGPRFDKSAYIVQALRQTPEYLEWLKK